MRCGQEPNHAPLGVISEVDIAIFVISLTGVGEGRFSFGLFLLPVYVQWRLRLDAVGCPQMLSHRDTRYTHVINVCSCILDLLAPMVDLSVALVVALLYKNINVIIPHLVSLFCRCDSRLVAPAPRALPWRRVVFKFDAECRDGASSGRRTNLIQKTHDSSFVLKIKCQGTFMGLNLRFQEN